MKPRRIRVDELPYAWIVREERGKPRHVRIDIFSIENLGQGQHLHVSMRFDNPWHHFGEMLHTPTERFHTFWATTPVTPSLVAAWIRIALASGWTPTRRAQPFYRCWLDGTLSVEMPPKESGGVCAPQ